MSGFVPRLFLAAAFVALPVTAFAQTTATPVAPTATTQTAPATLWRSDAAIVEAEKLIAAGKYVDALTVLDQVIARNLHNVEAHMHTATAWYYLGNNEKAKQAIKSTLLIDQKHIGAHMLLGLMALKEQNIDDASDYLRVIRMLCQGESCPEYQTLLRLIRETPPVEKRPWYHF